ncbi:MAG: sigma-70 family RNA polymerase sigma factor [Clostridia bacterium]|nr:sigma-70 family RNA polymerase sigma factor [Clostridia bacterium]
MDDQIIIKLYHQRDERAITETQLKYGAYCMEVAYRILENREDSEECVNDVYLKAWNSIPPHKPDTLRGFLAKITRNIALNRIRDNRILRRGGGEMTVALDELGECLSDGETVSDEYLRKELIEYINRFLRSLPRRDCDLFLCRYYFLYPTSEIAEKHGISEAHVRASLSRTRKKLKAHLEKQGLL